MKSPRLSSTNGRIISAKLRDQMYLKHLRQVEKINNREAEDMKASLKDYRSISELRHKNLIQNKRFLISEHERELDIKNEKMHRKIKNIKSMFSDASIRPNKITSNRYEDSNPESQLTKLPDSQFQQIAEKTEPQKSQKFSTPSGKEQTLSALDLSSKLEAEQSHHQSPNGSYHSLHYYFRKKQQERIELENKKLVGAIMNQRSPYQQKRLSKSPFSKSPCKISESSDPVKKMSSIKLPSVSKAASRSMTGDQKKKAYNKASSYKKVQQNSHIVSRKNADDSLKRIKMPSETAQVQKIQE